ncbi:hypothetical protein [Candidatus Nitrosocosmicus sp. T]
MIVDRREKVMVLLTKGLKGYQIANELDVDPATISRDIQYLSRVSSNNLNSIVKETLPFLYQSSIEGIKNILQECWNIYQSDNASITYLHKLNSLKLAKECNESLFKLVSEGPSLLYIRELEERLERIEENGKVAKQHL